MPDEQPTRVAEPDSTTIESGILDRLTYPDDQRPWSLDELIRDIGERLGVIDAVAKLRGLGLVHHTSDDLVFPTRAAVRAKDLEL